jgi:enoyl-CoA hydratase/carnithine racemase
MTFEGLVDRNRFPNADRVLTSVDGAVGLIELNEPEYLNPLNINELHLHYALDEMRVERDVRVVILTGRGRGFCAGRDLRSGGGPSDYDGRGASKAQHLAYGYAFGGTMWKTLHEFPKPIIAAVNGYALGGGWELAHLCDWVIAAESAVFGAVEIDVGVPPFAGSCTYLTRIVGKHLAMDLIVNGRKITAREALELHLVNRVVADADLLAEARVLADEIASRPPITVAVIKELVNEANDTLEHHKLERALSYYVQTLEDTRAAGSALANKQPRPEFHGR